MVNVVKPLLYENIPYMQQSEKDAERMSPTQIHHLWSIIPINDTINVSISGAAHAKFSRPGSMFILILHQDCHHT